MDSNNRDLPIRDRVHQLYAIDKDIEALTRQYNECKQRFTDLRCAILKHLPPNTVSDQTTTTTTDDDDEQFCASVHTSLHANRAYIDAYSEYTVLQLRISILNMKRRDLMDTDDAVQ